MKPPFDFLYQLGDLSLEWDTRKAERNRIKHGVTFSEGASVLLHPAAIIVDDEDHSQEEARFFLIGCSELGRILSISHTERAGRIRIISARPATISERREHDRTGRTRV